MLEGYRKVRSSVYIAGIVNRIQLLGGESRQEKVREELDIGAWREGAIIMGVGPQILLEISFDREGESHSICFECICTFAIYFQFPFMWVIC